MSDHDKGSVQNNAGKAIIHGSGGKLEITTRGKVIKQGQYRVDIVFVFDTTGSMSDKITGLLRTCDEFVKEANTLDLNPYWALISFGDIAVEGGGDRIDVVVQPTSDIDRIRHGLANIPRNSGFDNIGKSAFEATWKAFSLPYRDNTVKVLVLITDEPAHQHSITPNKLIKQLGEEEFLVFTVATDDWYYKEMAHKNGGVWKRISANTDLSEILAMFRDLARKVAKIARDVQQLANGSVRQYLLLPGSRRDDDQ